MALPFGQPSHFAISGGRVRIQTLPCDLTVDDVYRAAPSGGPLRA